MIHQQYNTFLLLKETVFFNFLTFLFDKELLHEYNIEVGYGDIAQSVRALASHARGRGFESLCLYHVAADGISFAATFLQKSLLTHSVAAPLRIEPAIAGLRFGILF